MNEREKQAVQAAKASRQTDKPTPDNQQKTTRVKESAAQTGGGLANKVDGISTNLAHSALKAIAVQTEHKITRALESGEFLTYFDDMFTNLDVGLSSEIESEYLMLEALNNSPKALPPVSLDGSSSSNSLIVNNDGEKK